MSEKDYQTNISHPAIQKQAFDMAANMGMLAFHGTPYEFAPTAENPLGEFNSEKIGTGEGAQAYGHGIYLAENPEVSRSYAKPDASDSTLMDINSRMKGLMDTMGKYGRPVNQGGGYTSPLGENAAKEYENLVLQSEARKGGKATVYKADIPDEHVNKMLDWDKPLSEQPKLIQDSFSGMVKDKNTPGSEIYKLISSRFNSAKQASEALNKMGIKGIKYLDQGSRGVGEGTRNFVLFDPSIAKIVGKE
jgi:hypothetical protein